MSVAKVQLRTYTARAAAAVVLMWAVLGIIGASPVAGDADTLSKRIDAVLSAKELERGTQAVVVKSLRSGRTLFARNADKALIPASNVKLITSAAALDALGPDFIYKTYVYADGEIKGGELEGNIILKGGGNPVLSKDDLSALASSVAGRGIKNVSGDIVVDDSLFDDQRLGCGWSWDDLPYYYSPEISALNVDGNSLEVWVSPGETAGARPKVKTVPDVDFIQVENTATTAAVSSAKDLRIGRRLGTNTITVEGVIPLGSKSAAYEERIAFVDPAVMCGALFERKLAVQGIRVSGQPRRKEAGTPNRPENTQLQLLAAHNSPPLSEILALMNKPSDNLIAEVLTKTLGAVVKRQGTTKAGIEAEMDFLKRAGVDTSGAAIVDGSGLSRLNYLTAEILVDLLAYMRAHDHGDVFSRSLAIAGVDGTLRRRMCGTGAQGKVRAKSGYLNRASALSGYAETQSGEPLAFSILMNGHLCANSSAKAAQDEICRLLSTLP